MLHVSHLIKGLMRMPTGKTVNNISDYRSERSKASDANHLNEDTFTSQSVSQDVDTTKAKEIFHRNIMPMVII